MSEKVRAEREIKQTREFVGKRERGREKFLVQSFDTFPLAPKPIYSYKIKV